MGRRERTATAIVDGIGMFDGVHVEKAFQIKPKEIYPSIAIPFKQVYSGTALMPRPAITYYGTTLVYGKDYDLSYENNINAGHSAKLIVTAKGNYSGGSSIQFSISTRNIGEAQISNIPDQLYDGNSKHPSPTIKYNGKILAKGVDYQLSYGSNYKAGNAYVYISGKGNFSGTVKKTFNIVASSSKVKVKSVSLTKKSSSLIKGKTLALKATISPSNATNKNVSWKSSNKKVATVNANGVVKGISKGKVTITVTTKDGSKKAYCVVTVTNPVVKVKSVKLSKKSATVKKGKTFKLKATVTPSNAANKSVSWSSSNKKIATVSSSGIIKGIKAGKATITVTTKDGKKKATCKVTVK